MKTIEKIEWIVAAVFLILGLSCLLIPGLDAYALCIAAAIISTFSAIVLWIDGFRKKRGLDFVLAIAGTLLAIFLWMHRYEGAGFLIDLFSFYMFFNFASFGVQAVLSLRERAEDSWMIVAECILYMLAFVLSLAFRRRDFYIIQYIFGAYLIIQGLQTILELYYFRTPRSSRTWSFRYWSALPVYAVALLPAELLRWMMKKKKRGDKVDYDQRKNDQPVNLRVFIHTGLSGDHQFGHMTFSYNGLMYSYGNYDKAEEKFFRSIGPGVLFTVPADIYVNNSCIYEGSTIFEFGLHITPAQEKKLQDTINAIFKTTYRWYCPLEKETPSLETFKDMESDYSCRLSWRTGAKFRKFYHGQWKTYWLMGVNCSLFASHVLHTVLPQIALSHSINTPGEYFEYFSTAFLDPDSIVVYRSWHTADEPSTLFPTLA